MATLFCYEKAIFPHRAHARRRRSADWNFEATRPIQSANPGPCLAAWSDQAKPFRSPIHGRRASRRRSLACRRRLAARARFSACPDAQGRRAGRRHRHLPPGGAAVHRQADRAGAELRRPGRHRHREHAAAQRAAPAHRRSERGAGAADRDLGGAQGHLQLARASWSRCSRRCWKTRRVSARPSSARCFLAKARLSRRRRTHGEQDSAGAANRGMAKRKRFAAAIAGTPHDRCAIERKGVQVADLSRCEA